MRRLDALGADDLDRRDQEVQHDPLGRPGERPLGELAQQLQVAIAGAVGARRDVGLRERVEHDGLGVDDHVDARQLAELLQLLVGEGRLGRAAAAEDVDLADPVALELVERVLGDVGGRQHLARAGEDARQVHRHVPVADHGRVLGGEVEAEAAEVRVGVVPAHELGGRVAAGQVLARDPHPPVGARAHRVDDRVVVRRQVGVGEVAPHLHVAVEAELGVGGDLVVDPGHRLDLLVVGRHPAAHQAEGRRQAVVHVDLDLEVLLRPAGARRRRSPRGPSRSPPRAGGAPACRGGSASSSSIIGARRERAA